MTRIMMVTAREGEVAGFVQALKGFPGTDVDMAGSGGMALIKSQAMAPDLVVVDRDLPDMTSFEFVGRLLRINAMVNTAVVSAMSEEDFHEAGEGLGILLRLDDPPGPSDASRAMDRLRAVLGPAVR